VREIPLLSSRLFVGPGALSWKGAARDAVGPSLTGALILTDRNCRRYAKPLADGLKESGVPVHLSALPPGELQ